MPNAASVRHRLTNCLRWTGKVFHISLQAFLVAFVIFQSYVVWQKTLPVPDYLLGGLREHLASEGLWLEHAEIEWLPPDRLAAGSVRVASSTHPGLVLEAESLVIEFSPAALLWKRFQGRTVSMDRGRITSPAGLTPSGEDRTLVDDLFFTVVRNDEEWTIADLLLRTGDLVANVRGRLPEIPDEPPEPVEELTWNEMLVRGVEEYFRFKHDVLDGVEEGVLNIAIERDLFGASAINARVSAKRFRHVSGIEFDRPEIQMAIVLNDTGRPASVSARTAAIRVPDRAEIRAVVADLTLPAGLGLENHLPTRVRLASACATILGESVGPLYVEGRRANEERADLSYFLRHEGESLRGRASLNWVTGEGVIEAFADVNPTRILDSPRVRDTGFRFDVEFEDAPELTAMLEFGPNWEPRHADLELRSGLCFIDGVELDAAYAVAQWIPNTEFDVTTLKLKRGDFEVGGSYWTDFRSRDYRLLFQGTFRPMHIDPWFQDWWGTLWGEFEFAGGPPVARVDLRGNWDRRDERIVSGSIEGRNSRIRGVDADRVRASYFVSKDDAHIFDARIDRTEGTVEGDLHYRGEEGYFAFDLKSGIDHEAAQALLGGTGTEILDLFALESPPEVRIKGRFQPGGSPEETSIKIAARSDGPLEFHGIPLDHLALAGLLAGSKLTLDPLDFGFSGGEARASAQIDTGENDPLLSFTFSIDDTSFGEALERLATNTGTGEISESALEELRNLGGKADFNLNAEGRIGDLLSFEGKGDLHVREADFGRIRLLGLLSRLLDQTPLRFTSLQLNEAESSFELENGVVRFPDLQMKGPNVGMEAIGDYYVEGGALDFNVKLFPLRQSPVPFVSAIFGRLLEPFGHILETSLSGTLEDPQWRLPFDPRRSFERSPAPSPENP